jgi:uncharacterized phage protein (TIGR02216 family)
MSGDFAAGATKLAGLIPRALGWRPDDFWNATPAELAAIIATGDVPQDEPLSRTELDRMLERERHG